ncbi:hypothetical protein SeMB42_g04427 [Synchytrium endobioticum]|uniref:MMS19 nucleotide excision repair protein n=1 Tax=Synchytrium endobioticum TaxID=286115 RepID=A0A507CMD8_9FUNG|nr:hypothetical protein SeLEV6574_g06771 [Synchytrium endobioticum]TPX44142.1 hypothetical protein SeMB42_g04427 [Synchytrium endobioticum]
MDEPIQHPERLGGPDTVASDINNGNFTLLQLVERLGPQLTSTDSAIRPAGIRFMVQVLTNLNEVPEADATVIFDFFVERLHDVFSLDELANGILLLTNLDVLSKADMLRIPTSIFQNVQVQSHAQSVRNAIFRILSALMYKIPSGIASLGSDFAIGYIRVMDGEKDPRNLLVAFDVLRQILLRVPLSSAHVQELFDLTFAYFPITYRPPPGDPLNISAEDLKAALRSCLTATNAFAPFAMAQLMDKMETTTGSGKRDTMLTIAVAIPTYGPDCLLPYAKDLSQGLKAEVFQAADEAHQKDATTCVTAVAKGLSSATATSSSNPLEVFIDPILEDAVANLKEPDSKFAKQCSALLEAVASASDPACTYVVNTVCGQILDQYSVEMISPRQKPLVDVLAGLVRSHRIVYECSTATMMSISQGADVMEVDELTSPLQAYKSRLIDIFTSCTLNSGYSSALKLTAISGIQELLASPRLLGSDEHVLLKCLTEVVLSSRTEPEVQQSALQVLVDTSHRHPHAIIKHSLNVLLCDLADSQTNAGYERKLNAIKDMTAEAEPFKVALDGVFNELFRHVKSLSSLRSPPQLDYTHCLIRAVLAIIKTRSKFQTTTSSPNIISQLETSLLIPILTQCIGASLQTSPSAADTALTDVQSVKLFGEIAGCIVRSMDGEQQETLANKTLSCFVEGNLDVLLGDGVAGRFAPLEPTSKPSQTNLSIVFSSIICNLRPMVSLSLPQFANVSNFLEGLIERVLASKNDVFVVAISKTIGSIVNKWSENAAKVTFAEALSAKADTVLTSTSTPISQRFNLLCVDVWVIAALLKVSSVSGYTLVSQLISLLDNADLGQMVANHFRTLVKNDAEGVLTRDSFANVQLLYKQRLFNHCVPLLVNGFHKTSSDRSYRYLIALLYLMQNTSESVYFPALAQLMPLLLRALSSPDSDLKLTTLNIFETLTTKASHMLVKHISSLMPLLFGLCRMADGGANPAKVRLESLRMIGLLPGNFEYASLHPFKPTVLKEVGKFLDDPKRIVRKEAANTRNKWFLMVGPR